MVCDILPQWALPIVKSDGGLSLIPVWTLSIVVITPQWLPSEQWLCSVSYFNIKLKVKNSNVRIEIHFPSYSEAP